MALYETYLDALWKGRRLMDSYAESDPEAVVQDDLQEDPNPSDDQPVENHDWYPDWNGNHTPTHCHCGRDREGSDHCPECGCEEYETVCDYVYEPATMNRPQHLRPSAWDDSGRWS